MGYNFKNREVAEELKRIAQHKMGTTNSPDVPAGNVVIFVKAPTDGIDAINGTTMTSGTCTKMLINKGATDTDLDERTEIEIEVYNTTSEDIAGGSVFQAARVGEYWVSLSGGGGGGGGDQMFQLQNSAEIGAASGLTFGTGSASLLKINVGATAYEDAGEPAVTMINPFEEAVPSGSMITAYKKTHTFADDSTDDRYVIVQISCPSGT